MYDYRSKAGHEAPPVVDARRVIDDIDRNLVELLRRRRQVSQLIQRNRVDAGGPRIEPAREAYVRSVYGSGLGELGEGVAAAVLRMCRG